VLSPAEELKTFHLTSDNRLGLVVSEPIVQHPVAAQFDQEGFF
jgi:hypothetical protein